MIRSAQHCHSYSARGASSAGATRQNPVTLSADDIARLTDAPLRTVQYRLMRWHDRGGPVARVARPGGGWRYSVSLEDYAARVGRDPDEVRAELDALGVAQAA